MGIFNENDLIDFALRWEPFGGGDEFILPEFGIAPVVFYRRLLRILASTTTELTAPQRRRIAELCRSKLVRACAAKGSVADASSGAAEGLRQRKTGRRSPVKQLPERTRRQHRPH